MIALLATCIILSGVIALCLASITAGILFKAWLEERENEAHHGEGIGR